MRHLLVVCACLATLATAPAAAGEPEQGQAQKGDTGAPPSKGDVPAPAPKGPAPAAAPQPPASDAPAVGDAGDAGDAGEPGGPAAPAKTRASAPASATVHRNARVLSVPTAGTLRVRLASGQRRTVRLAGLDTPRPARKGTPADCGSAGAIARLKRLALGRRRGRSVRLTTEPAHAAGGSAVLVAYVDGQGRDFGAEMLRAGWATLLPVPLARLARFERAQSSAKALRRGLWKRCDGGSATTP